MAETGLWRGNVEDEVDGCSRAQRSPGRLVDGSPTMSGTKDRETLLGQVVEVAMSKTGSTVDTGLSKNVLQKRLLCEVNILGE